MLVYSYGTRGVEGTNEEEFVEGMKEFVAQPDARQRVNVFAAMLFEVMHGHGQVRSYFLRRVHAISQGKQHQA